ncbi:PDZ and LIM domain protein 7 isoform X55 [Gallus gallus]|uniref:PDZ and LIM domain protein 7 isoform X55 n=1 Tax=Gallus gallus TaxID=9031 RepID=UPI001F023AD2|nr:PDZ and LIM domain protein 7 isoform X55 [Gallus gallus]
MSQSRLCPPRRARKVPAVPFRRGAAACPAPGPADSCQREHGASIPPARNPAEMGSHPEMGEMESYKVMLNGPAPWGFRLQGGKDFSMPLSISRLTPGGKAAQAGVGVGDWVLYIDGESTGTMTHIEAQNRIRACGDRLCLTLSRAQNHLGKPQKDSLPCSEPPKYNFAPSTALNKTARPFGASSPPNPRPGLVTKPVTYVPLAPACTPQHNGKPQEHPSSPKYDPSKLHLIEDSEDWQPRNTSTQSRSFLKLAQLTGTDSFEDHEDEPVRKPRGPRVSFWGTEEEWQSMHPPGTPACDPGKLRLMEDAEDWQPRTGTSQSRSFRKLARLTGTDGLEDHEDEPVRKPSQVSVPDPSPGAAMKTEPGLAPRTPAATPGPTSRPPWAVDPSFAERYAPDKTSTVLSKHSQPATPTPMQNRSSIVQAAQQAPESPGRTPLCYKCNKIIRGRYLVALGHYYHPEEFTCCQCRKVLDEGGFFEEKGSIFCPKCYDTRYAPSCAKCKKKITGEVMHALKMTWHVQCFTCAACKTPIRNRAFYMEEGQPYCERDYEKMFGTKCRGCDFKIDAGDRFLEALGFSWHDTCFVCAICQTNLEGKTFYSKKDKPLCKSHAFSHV